MSIRVLVVDDSSLMRTTLGDFVHAAPDMELAGTASDGERALDKVRQLKPNVVTLDVQMPRMDGLETLDAILRVQPLPVIMVSAMTQRGADITLDALERGALDYVAKPGSGTSGLDEFREEFLRKIRSMAGVNVDRVLQIRKNRAAARLVVQAKICARRLRRASATTNSTSSAPTPSPR